MKMPRLILCCLLSFLVKSSFAQPCIAAFPYNQGFEASDGGWTTGGTASDWTWGTPSKAVISSAASGTRCWVTGGLTGSSYNNGENAWLMSPCFDFSAMTNPEISFKIFWETERRFDGATFQYSIDGGNNWTLLGNANSNNCDILNWYNAASITYLGNIAGWSGNIQSDAGSCLGGNGSGAWVTAKHPLTALAGQSNVRFRFLFGAGTTCNAYDGFAVDDIEIKEAVAGSVSINKTCHTNGKIVQFSTDNSCISSYQWDFDDPSSGTNNVSTLATPQHEYDAPGEYHVILTATFANGSTTVVGTTVVIILAAQNINWPGACNNTPNATLTLTATGSSTPYFYSWDTSPPQTTNAISNVGAGNYSAIVSSMNACPVTYYFNLSASNSIDINAAITNSVCGPTKGSVLTTVTGGSGPYSFLWSNGATTAAILHLTAGTYSVAVTDANGCTKTGGPYTIINEDRQLTVNLGADRAICPGESVTLSPGNFQSYLWQDGSSNPTFTTNTTGRYYVKVTDAEGCSGSDTLQLKAADCRDVYFPSAFTPNNDGRNDGFGPLGNAGNLRQYSLRIYGRYGQLIFSSNDPLQKWNGLYKGEPMQTGNYIWMSSYILSGQWNQRKGSLLLIR